MSEPKTLLAMAGADPTPGRLSASSLLLIDCQMEYVDGALPLTGVEAALDEVSRLLVRARAADTPVIHVAHAGAAGGPFDRAAPRGQFAAQAAPIDGETVIEKSLPNCFAGTDLEAALKATGRGELIVAGFMTHMCVSATVRRGLDLGFRTTVIASAAATRDLPCATGGDVVAAELLHKVSLAALADRFAVIAQSSADLSE